MDYKFGRFVKFVEDLMTNDEFLRSFRKHPERLMREFGLLDIQRRALLKRDPDLLETLYILDSKNLLPFPQKPQPKPQPSPPQPQPQPQPTGNGGGVSGFNTFVRAAEFLDVIESAEADGPADQ